MDFDFDKWLNDIGAAGTPGAATFLSPAPAPAPAPSNQEVSTLPTLPILDDALLAVPTTVIQPPVATGTFVTNEIASASVPFGVAMGPTVGAFGFAVGTSGAAGPSGSSGLGFAAPEARVAALKVFFNDAKALYAEVEGWQDMVPLENRDARVLAGNKTHQLAMQVCWNRFVSATRAKSSSSAVDCDTPRYLPRRQARSSCAGVCRAHSRTLRRVCGTEHGYRVGLYLPVQEPTYTEHIYSLTWPVIISGSQVQDPYRRQQVIMAFDYFRKQCCFEIESSQRIVAEVWRRIDAGEPRDDWRSVVEDLGLRILVL
jgi:hypothetical protein